jgi:hypothetical protein
MSNTIPVHVIQMFQTALTYIHQPIKQAPIAPSFALDIKKAYRRTLGESYYYRVCV